jgi:HAD superfamily phosphoserine phosphatase-like hydrolase
MRAPFAVFVDFDGTITDIDTFDALVRAAAGDDAWIAIDDALVAGRITLRAALEQQAALVRLSREEALAFLEANAHVDPAFGPFVAAVREHGGTIRVLSAGIAAVIHDALGRAGVEVEVLANEVDFSADGWTVTFIDDSDNGHDKAAHVRAAQAAGAHTVFVGDGISDFDAAVVADQRFAKRGRALEAYCRERAIPCTTFRSFDEIGAALFA